MPPSRDFPINECLRCGHTWRLRYLREPKKCPHCYSYVWFKPKHKIPGEIPLKLPPFKPKCPSCQITGMIAGCKACQALLDQLISE